MLTSQQITALKAFAAADQTAAALMASADDVGLAAWFNGNNGAFTVWRSSVPIYEVGEAFEASGLSAMTSTNNDRLSSFAAWNPRGVVPSRGDHRTFFDDVFSPASGATTRTRLSALWRRIATRAEQALATGTGSNAAPATLVFEGKLSYIDASNIRSA